MTTKPTSTKTLTVELPLFQVRGLEDCAKVVPHDGDADLLAVVISRGILSILDREEHSLSQLGTELAPLDSSASANPFGKRKRPPINPHVHQEVDRYIGVPLTEELRERLEDALITNNESDHEGMWRRILELGLDQIEKDPSAIHEDPSKAFDELQEIKAPLSAKQKIAWRILCAAIERGWR